MHLVSTATFDIYRNDNAYDQEHFPTKPVKTEFGDQFRVLHL